MEKVDKKVKFSHLVVQVGTGKDKKPLLVSKELYEHILNELPQRLIDVHKYHNEKKK